MVIAPPTRKHVSCAVSVRSLCCFSICFKGDRDRNVKWFTTSPVPWQLRSARCYMQENIHVDEIRRQSRSIAYLFVVSLWCWRLMLLVVMINWCCLAYVGTLMVFFGGMGWFNSSTHQLVTIPIACMASCHVVPQGLKGGMTHKIHQQLRVLENRTWGVSTNRVSNEAFTKWVMKHFKPDISHTTGCHHGVAPAWTMLNPSSPETGTNQLFRS